MADVHEHSNSIYLDALADSFLLAWVLSQAWSYYTWFAQDTTAKKVNVAILVFLSVVQSFIEDFKLWFVLVRNGEWQKSSLLWSDLAVSGITNSIVGIWFILRCWKMVERNRWVLWTMCALWGLVVCANVVNIAQVSVSLQHVPKGSTPAPSSATNILFACWTTGSLILDSAVATILIIKLQRSKTGLSQTDQTVQRIIRMTWETALLPAVSFLLAVILFQAGHELSMFFVLITSKLHVIGFLRSLNARRFLRNQVQSEKLGRISLSGSLPWIDQHVEGGLQSATGQASEEIPIHILSRDDGAAEKIIASGSQDQLQEVCLRRVTLRDTEKEG